ncbi:MAG: peptidoglycan DD-metalloendopeptidase family protein [Anaerolineae bacterium]|nr:peptidoglycan DD-metalloendopeptidase family protein [Anaerolineae bacterium]
MKYCILNRFPDLAEDRDRLKRDRRLLRAAAAGARALIGVSLVFPGALVAAKAVAAGPGSPPSDYIVQPGDTLDTIAARVGVSPDVLVQTNAIQNPYLIYPGQRLALAGAVGRGGGIHDMSTGESLATLSRAKGASLDAVARANRLLRVTRFSVGWHVWLPEGPQFRVVTLSPETLPTAALRVAAAVMSGAHLWDVLWLNPAPHTAGQALLIPDIGAAEQISMSHSPSGLPFPLVDLALSPQPVSRGETVVVSVTASESVTCRLQYFDQTEACMSYPGDSRLFALAGLSPMLEPGAYTIVLLVTTADGTSFEVPIPLQVGEGRYDYERIDLPPDRQALLDPDLSQRERDKIAQMRTVRSPVRLWEYPFQRPVDAAITSYFGSRRSYGYGFGSFHAGSDFDGVGGEPVVAPASGTVILAEPLVVRGNAILLDHGWGVVSGFWHLSEIDVEVGQRVAQGQRLGALGNTGLSTGAHLHWELWVNGAAVNALSWLERDGPAAVVGTVP